MKIIFEIAFILYLFSPTFIANGLPVVAKNIPYIKRYSYPVSERLFGKNKTYRGFIAGIGGAILLSVTQFYMTKFLFFTTLTHDYYSIVFDVYIAITVGLLQGFGALIGDIVKSFFKRKIGKKPGEAWPVFDGIDYILGGVLFFSFIYTPNFFQFIVLLCVGPVASLLANIGAYFIKWKEVPY